MSSFSPGDVARIKWIPLPELDRLATIQSKKRTYILEHLRDKMCEIVDIPKRPSSSIPSWALKYRPRFSVTPQKLEPNVVRISVKEPGWVWDLYVYKQCLEPLFVT